MLIPGGLQVSIEELQDLGLSSWKRVKQAIRGQPLVLKDVFIEVSFTFARQREDDNVTSSTRRSRRLGSRGVDLSGSDYDSAMAAMSAVEKTCPFNVNEDGFAHVHQVLRFPRPVQGQRFSIRVMHPSKWTPDALLGEVEVPAKACGLKQVELVRGGESAGILSIQIVAVPLGPEVVPMSKNDAKSLPASNTPGVGRAIGRASGKIQKEVQAHLPHPEVQRQTSHGGGEVCCASLACCSLARIMEQPWFSRFSLRVGKWQNAADFLAFKGKDQSVVWLDSGLGYKVIRQGSGVRRPLMDTPCLCHYRGMLINGVEFDASYKNGHPAQLTPKDVIEGWSEALRWMVEGDHWELYIPPRLGYGPDGVGDKIPGGAALVYQVELISIL